MSEQAQHPPEVADLLARLEATVRQLVAEPADFYPHLFDGSQGIFEKTEQRGEYNPLSFGVYNPVAAHAYLGIGGRSASSGGGAFAIPPKAALILPLKVGEAVRIGIDSEELGEEKATVWTMRFRTVQPFFLGAI